MVTLSIHYDELSSYLGSKRSIHKISGEKLKSFCEESAPALTLAWPGTEGLCGCRVNGRLPGRILHFDILPVLIAPTLNCSWSPWSFARGYRALYKATLLGIMLGKASVMCEYELIRY